MNELVQGRLKEGKETYAFFLDVQTAYDSVWRNGLWLKLWELGKMWRVTRVQRVLHCWMKNGQRHLVCSMG